MISLSDCLGSAFEVIPISSLPLQAWAATASKGPYILDAIRALDDILTRMGEVQRKSRTLMRHIHSWDQQ